MVLFTLEFKHEKSQSFPPVSLSLFRPKKVVQHLSDLVGRADFLVKAGLPLREGQLWRKG